MSARRLPSVTNLLGQGYPKQDVLKPWAARFTAEVAVDEFHIWQDQPREQAVQFLKGAHRRKTKKAQIRGTDVHAWAEVVISGGSLFSAFAIPEHIAPYVDQFCDFLTTHSPDYLRTEAVVYNLTHDYAGTLDGLAYIAGLPGLTLLDYKTTDKGPGEFRPPYEDTLLQLVAYARAEYVGTEFQREDTGSGRHYIWPGEEAVSSLVMPDSAAVLVLSPVDWKLVPARIEDEEWQAFLAAATLARWRKGRAKSCYRELLTKEAA